jgi:hypothetical protein
MMALPEQPEQSASLILIWLFNLSFLGDLAEAA